MASRQGGFTLIELVVVIVILGVLAATALPKFINLSDSARQAAVKGVAAAATSGFAINYGARKASANGAVAITGTAAAICTNTNAAGTVGSLMTGGLPAGYTVTVGSGVSCVSNDGATGTCNVADAQLAAASAVITYICVN